MRFSSASLSAAVLICGLVAGATPSAAASATDVAATAIQQVSDRDGRRGGWDRPQHRRNYGWDNDRRRGWGQRRHSQWGNYRPNRRCRTEFVIQFGPYGAQWVPVQRCSRGW